MWAFEAIWKIIENSKGCGARLSVALSATCSLPCLDRSPTAPPDTSSPLSLLRSSMLRPTPSLSSHLKGGRARPYPFRCFFPREAAAAALLFQRCHRYRRALRALHGPSNPWSRNTLSHSRCLLSRLRTQRTVVVAGFSPTTVAATPFPVRAAVVRLIVPLFVGLISA
jgi:hypothetical protein